MAELTFLPVRDSKLTGLPEFTQSFNYGGASKLRHIVLYSGSNKTTWERTIVEFDVSDLAGAALSSAKLVRNVISVTSIGTQTELIRCTRPGEWVESQVTWLQYKIGAVWTNEGGDFDETGPPGPLTYNEPATSGEHEIAGLLPFVDDALANRGGIVSLITRLTDENPETDAGATWYSSEGAESWRLVVETAQAVGAGHRTVRQPSRRPAIAPARPARARAATRPTQPRRSTR